MKYLLNEIALRISDFTDSPNLDAQVLLAHLVGKSQSWVLAHPELMLSATQKDQLDLYLDQMSSGIPLPYILGRWEFYGLQLKISRDVLIPRPETELLVEKALDWLKVNPERRKGIDMGTGSGCIAIALAVHIPDLMIKAVDVAENAIKIARENASLHNVSDQIEFILSNLWENFNINYELQLPEIVDRSTVGVDLITANLPYIPSSILNGLMVHGREPDLALDGGMDGFKTINGFLKSAPLFLRPGGLLLMELESSLGSETLHLAKVAFPGAKIQLHQDLAGLDRIIEIRQKE